MILSSNRIDPRCHVGETHGVYTLVDVLEEKDKYGHYIYKGICNECGYEKYAHYGDFNSMNHVTTICNHIDVDGKYIRYVSWNNKRIRKIFFGMKNRCYNENDESYQWYGFKGVRICDEWINNPKLFEDWSIKNGYDDNLTIDRKDENKDYCPENCRWIPLEENSKYKSTTCLINVDGEVHTGREWSKVLGLGTNRINTYIRQYGIDNTIKFIKKFKNNPNLKPKQPQSYYDLYMSS